MSVQRIELRAAIFGLIASLLAVIGGAIPLFARLRGVESDLGDLTRHDQARDLMLVELQEDLDRVRTQAIDAARQAVEDDFGPRAIEALTQVGDDRIRASEASFAQGLDAQLEAVLAESQAEFEAAMAESQAEYRRALESMKADVEEQSQALVEAQRELQQAELARQQREAEDAKRLLDFEVARRALPAEVGSLLDWLATPTSWKPERIGGRNVFDRSTLYAGPKRPQSLAALAAAGALDPEPDGLFTLYAVLATQASQRPALPNTWGLYYGVSWEGYKYDAARLMSQTPDDEALRARLETLQGFLREWRRELIAREVLSE